MNWQLVIELIPSWLLMVMAIVGATEALLLCGYLLYHHDHLILRAADLGLLSIGLVGVAVHYGLIVLQPGDVVRGVALSRIMWCLLLGMDIFVLSSYLFPLFFREVLPKWE
jgi:hypothetical protein